MWITDDNNKYLYCTRTLGELLIQITDQDMIGIEKINRPQIYMTYDGNRPKRNQYNKWNGLQVFDIDLKLWNGNIEYLKMKIYEILKNFHWFLWIVKSASGKGLHIYTKVTPPHHVYIDIEDNEKISKYWYKINYQQKSSIIYRILLLLHEDKKYQIRFDEEINGKPVMYQNECQYLDNVVRRITAGIRLTYDDNPLINKEFQDLQIPFGLTQTLSGFSYPIEQEEIFFRQTNFNIIFIIIL
jgi:hypothetical protein